ncbi:MAG: hypothetical protein JKY18_11185 [Flavobacteriales bacterium]|nr:hypothetical protein [Flavobacteriales bacterium]MBL4735876.1 hypothetical protein [Flavobacteriales bacterium]
MKERKRKVGLIAIAMFATTMLVSCGSEPSPLESMKAPILVVRNDSITEVKDSAGKLYVLNNLERSNYAAALLKPGDVLEVIVK